MHIGVDVLGLPHAIMVTTANVTDRSGAIEMVDYYCDVTNHLSLLKKLLADGGYTGENFANEIKRMMEILEINAPNYQTLFCTEYIVTGLLGAIRFALEQEQDFDVDQTTQMVFRLMFNNTSDVLGEQTTG